MRTPIVRFVSVLWVLMLAGPSIAGETVTPPATRNVVTHGVMAESSAPREEVLMFFPQGGARRAEVVMLHTADQVTVYGTFSPARPNNDKVLLLFHQARASRHEYDSLIARFNQLGYDTLAIDQRSGGQLFGGQNQTVAALGKSADYLQAAPDLDAALAWARDRHYATVVAVGSSYSSALVILLAARHPPGLTAIASFSPGEYFDDKNLIKTAAAKVTVPFYITTGPDEADNVTEVLRNAHGDNIVHYQPEAGVHGASTLVEARDPAGHAANLKSFEDFLRKVGH